jgi:RNA polymerase sigma factor (TIGR02999 family)
MCGIKDGLLLRLTSAVLTALSAYLDMTEAASYCPEAMKSPPNFELLALNSLSDGTNDESDRNNRISKSTGQETEASSKAAEIGASRTPEELLEILYDDLRRLAASKMAREHAQRTLQPTALVHEAWLKLDGQDFQSKAHFFGAAAEAMRRILIDRARSRGRQKRGRGVQKLDYEESRIEAPVQDAQLLAVHEALEVFALEDPAKAEVVKLRFFAGLTHGEIATLLSVSEKTARRHWQIAKIRLYQLISGDESPMPE